MGSKWAEWPEKITNWLGWVGRKVVENNVCPMGMGWAQTSSASPLPNPGSLHNKLADCEFMKKMRGGHEYFQCPPKQKIYNT